MDVKRASGAVETMSLKNYFILIIYQYGWHAPILGPLAEILSQHYKVARITMASFEAEPYLIEQEPDLIIVADAGTAVALRSKVSDITILHVGHGLISKNGPALSYFAADYVCVASSAIVERLTAQGHVPRRAYLPTGLIQSDPLFRRRDGERASDRGKSVVYAPTWTPFLTSASMLGDRLVPLIRGENAGIRIVIKPHPHLAVAAPDLIKTWRGLAERHENVVLQPPDADLIPTLLDADLMVSDASSAVFHFLALDRPIVLIDNPERSSSQMNFDPDGIEWQWRDIGMRVSEVGDLRSAVAASLADPDRYGAARRARRANLFGERTDGRARERVAEAVGQIVRGEI